MANGIRVTIGLVLTLSLIGPTWVHADEAAQMQPNVPRTCADLRTLDTTLADPQSAYFRSWHHDDYIAAIDLSNACSGPNWSYAKANRSMLLQVRERDIAQAEAGRQEAQRRQQAAEQLRWNQAAESARQTDVNRRHDEATIVFMEKSGILGKCKDTRKAQLYAATQALRADLDIKKAAEDEITSRLLKKA